MKEKIIFKSYGSTVGIARSDYYVPNVRYINKLTEKLMAKFNNYADIEVCVNQSENFPNIYNITCYVIFENSKKLNFYKITNPQTYQLLKSNKWNYSDLI